MYCGPICPEGGCVDGVTMPQRLLLYHHNGGHVLEERHLGKIADAMGKADVHQATKEGHHRRRTRDGCATAAAFIWTLARRQR